MKAKRVPAIILPLAFLFQGKEHQLKIMVVKSISYVKEKLVLPKQNLSHTIDPHPCYYKKTGDDQVDYVTFTHSKNIDIKNENGEITGTLETKELTSNINKEERKQGIKTNVVPIDYQGKRSALGEEKDDFSLVPEDKKIVDTIFDSSPKRPAPKRKRQ